MITLTQVIGDTISGIVINLPWFILFIWGVRTIAKQVPHWLEQYEQIKDKQRRIDWATNRR